MTIDNEHKVPKQMWNKWSDEAKELFNDSYGAISGAGPDVFTGPDTKLSTEEFDVIAWNASVEVAFKMTAITKKRENVKCQIN